MPTAALTASGRKGIISACPQSENAVGQAPLCLHCCKSNAFCRYVSRVRPFLSAVLVHSLALARFTEKNEKNGILEKIGKGKLGGVIIKFVPK